MQAFFFNAINFILLLLSRCWAFYADMIDEGWWELIFPVQVLGISTDSHFSHLAWINLSRKQGGLGGLDYPLVSDFNKAISRDYGVLIEEAGIALRKTPH